MQVGLIGFGSVGKQLYSTLLENNYSQEQLFIFDDQLRDIQFPNVFRFQDFKQDRFRHLSFIPTLGYLSKVLKKDILNYLLSHGYDIFSFVHPTAFVSSNARVGKGVIVYPLCNIDQGAVIGDGAVLLNSCVIAHDSSVGMCSYLAPAVCVSGFVKIGQLCFVGASSSLSNNISIGENSTIAIGTCVTRSIPEGSFAIGNPFRLKKTLTLT